MITIRSKNLGEYLMGMVVAKRRLGASVLAWMCVVVMAMGAPSLTAGQRTLFDFGHLDIAWTYAGGEWSLKLVWDETFPELEVEAANGVLVAKNALYADGEGSRIARPAGMQWDFIGAAEGVDIWVLPSFSFGNPILEPGFATYGVPLGGPDVVRIDLVDVEFFGEGEAHFSMFTDANQVHMATSDGMDAGDFYLMGRGDHRHMSWAFTEQGVYRITFTASMLQVAGDEASRTTSEPQAVLFAVGVSDMALWLLERGVGPERLGVEDSPAGDGVPNLLKYALGLPPLESVTAPVVVATRVEEAGESFLGLDVALNPDATGIELWAETSGDLEIWQSGTGHVVELERTDERLHARDAQSMEDAQRRFIRLAVKEVADGDGEE